jgi:uncharacterized protein involved in outer membrane biogenesis
MIRTLRIFCLGFAVLFGLLAILVVAAGAAVVWLDWNRFKPQIETQVSAALGRPFAIHGDLSVDWAPDPGAEDWLAWVPWPRISAQDITLGNPDWASTPVMVSLKRVQLGISPLPLLQHRVVIRGLQLTSPAADLQRLADGRANWELALPQSEGGEQAGPPWTVDIDQIGFDQGTVTFTDATLKADVTVQIDPLGKPVSFAEVTGTQQPGQAAEPPKPTAPAAVQANKQQEDPEADQALSQAEQVAPTAERAPRDYVFGWKAAGRYHDLPFKGEGRIGGMLAVQDPKQPFPVQAQVEAGRTKVSVAGTLTDPKHMGALNLRLAISGASMSDLYPLTGVALPDTPAYSTDGRLIASLRNPAGPVFAYRDFNGRVGQSDLHGSLRFTLRKPRPKLSGQLWSNQLRMADLGPLIGVKPKNGNAPKATTTAAAPAPSGKVLPTEEFRTERWRDMDADVAFYGRRIQHGGQLPLSELNTHIVMDGGKLAVDPLRFGMAGGTIAGTLQIDGSQTPMAGRLQMGARSLQLKQLFPDMHSPQAQGALGQLRGNIAFSGRGNSVAALLGSADGEVHALVNDGVVSRGLTEIAGLNVGNYVMSKLFGDDDVQINCAAADLEIKRGVMSTRAMIFDTENSIVDVQGTASFRDETLNLTISPESKGFRMFSLRSPLYVRGTFANPDPGVQVGPLLARGAGMVALSLVLTPAAGLLALMVGPSSGDDAEQSKHCAGLLAEASKPARAPVNKK